MPPAPRRSSSKRAVTPRIRAAGPDDLGPVVALAAALWPDDPINDHRKHMRAVLAGRPDSTLPLVVLVAELRARAGAEIIGFIEVGLRSHAQGCDGRRAVGFVEGWGVAAAQRGRGVGRKLMDAAADWARGQGCTELASDTWQSTPSSQKAHLALGFEEVDRVVNFRKPLRQTRH
jgi:aminoglycoside 6'-N-acetyltransferase I